MHVIFEALTVVNSITLSVLVVRYVKFTRFVQSSHTAIHDKHRSLEGKLEARPKAPKHSAEFCSACGRMVVLFDPVTKVCANCQRKGIR